MRVELNYESNIFGECPTDYDISKINDENELKFLKWMTILQSTTTRLRYNIELFDYYFILYLCNDVIKNKFKCYFTLLMSNISTALSVDFSCLFSNENDLNIDNFKSFCYKYPAIFKNEPISEALTKTKIATKKAKEKYKEFFEIARNKIFAHSDDILLDDRNAENIVAKISTKIMNELLSNVIDILSPIWSAYNGQKLCFSLANGDDYKELTKSLCTLYGDVKFI